MEDAGIDTSVLRLILSRGATCSTAAIAGCYHKGYPRCCRLVFRRYFSMFLLQGIREKDGTIFGRTVLSINQSSNNAR